MTNNTNLSLVLKDRTKIEEEKIDVDKEFYRLKLETASGETKVAITVPENLIPEWMRDVPIESVIDIDFKKTQKTLEEISPPADDGKNEKLQEEEDP